MDKYTVLSRIFSMHAVAGGSGVLLVLFTSVAPLSAIVAAIVAFFFLAILPLIVPVYLYFQGKADIEFSDKAMRKWPYITAVISYLLGALFFWWLGIHALAVFLTAYLVVTSLVAMINTRWKISAHTSGVAGPITAFVWIFGPILIPLYLIVPFVGWVRLRMHVHTQAQLVAGAILAAVVTAIVFALLY
jgi:membrane-associated phospholipid phosphatase